MAEMKLAVDSGYWLLYRYNPLLARQGKNPLVLDSKDPKVDYQAFLDNEIRYRTLKQQFPESARSLFAQAALEAKARHEIYKKLAETK
jgi:pyruvate-ferredoxin/flavodoxin oxidoreductase